LSEISPGIWLIQTDQMAIFRSKSLDKKEKHKWDRKNKKEDHKWN